MSVDASSTADISSEPAAAASVSATWLSLKELGNVAFGLGDIAGAIVAYEKALMAAPDDAARVALYGNLALAHLRAGELSAAVSRCDEGLKLSTDSEKLLFRKAKALVQLKDSSAADAVARLEAAHPGSKGAAELRALLSGSDAAAGSSPAPSAPAAAPLAASPRVPKSDSLRKAMAAAMSSGSLYDDKPQARAVAPGSSAGRSSGSGAGSGFGIGSVLSACWDALCCRRKRGAPASATGSGTAAAAAAAAGKDKTA